MEGTWSLRVGPEVHSGLSLYRLEALVRSGTLEAHHMVYGDGRWMRVDEVPYLLRQLRIRAAVSHRLKEQQAVSTKRKDNVVELFPDASLAMLPVRNTQAQTERKHRLGRVVMGVAFVLLFAEVAFLLYSTLLVAR